MVSYIKQALLSPWGFTRWLRLIVGVLFLVQAIYLADVFIGIVAGLLLLQALSNTGCCGVGAPCTRPASPTAEEGKEPQFEEIKADRKE
ncbi:hypothetical protein QWY31_10885 [Cytophagales bacterium LB-30]|uniref:DUF2892 domain-containing protein n=1 Tax=Shiella aurantiaca TaxID=3058365 RepID=A0ABT8F6M0_9BACT|nr:hypothetical protein [Shiella aurantiaca]MDN4166009.1 hypothetical protein [Shiella aurantiaca]